MKTRGWTQEKLAEKTGMRQPSISGLMTPGKTRPNIETLRRVAEAFDCGLAVRFVPYSDLVQWSEKFDPDSFAIPEFQKDREESEKHALAMDRLTDSSRQALQRFGAALNAWRRARAQRAALTVPPENISAEWNWAADIFSAPEAMSEPQAMSNVKYIDSNPNFDRITRKGVQTATLTSQQMPLKFVKERVHGSY